MVPSCCSITIFRYESLNSVHRSALSLENVWCTPRSGICDTPAWCWCGDSVSCLSDHTVVTVTRSCSSFSRLQERQWGWLCMIELSSLRIWYLLKHHDARGAPIRKSMLFIYPQRSLSLYTSDRVKDIGTVLILSINTEWREDTVHLKSERSVNH